MTRRVRLAALFVFLTGTVLGAGQNPAPASSQPPPPSPQGPTFRVRVDYVEVDVVVTDRDGNLVRDLKKEDFQVLEDGKPQTISAFTLVDIPIERPDRPLFQAEPIEPDVRSNEQPFDGRIYVMVIDDNHTNFGRTQRVRAAAKQFIERRLAANDLMAIVHTFGSSDANQEFTSNKRLLLAAVDRTQGRKLKSATANRTAEYYRTRDLRQQGDPINDPEDAERAFNARSTLDTLRQVADWFAKEGWEIKFAPIDQFYVHIDLMVCMLNEHCAAVCIETTEDDIIQWLKSKKIEIIPVPFQDTVTLGCNVMSLGKDRVIAGGLGHTLEEHRRAMALLNETFAFTTEEARAAIRGKNAARLFGF